MRNSLLIPLFFLITSLSFSQEVIPAAGGSASNNGTVNFTVGQMLFNVKTGSNGSLSEGVQQSIELFTLSNPELKVLNLKAITYPNPTKDRIILSLTENILDGLSFTIFDIKGRLVKKGNVNKENTVIPMRSFASGIYLLKVHQNKKQIKTFKIVKN